MTEYPTKQLTNTQYIEYLELREKTKASKPKRLTWFLLGVLVGIFVTVIVSAFLSHLNMIWLIH